MSSAANCPSNLVISPCGDRISKSTMRKRNWGTRNCTLGKASCQDQVRDLA
jgi:hypothetical protein